MNSALALSLVAASVAVSLNSLQPEPSPASLVQRAARLGVSDAKTGAQKSDEALAQAGQVDRLAEMSRADLATQFLIESRVVSEEKIGLEKATSKSDWEECGQPQEVEKSGIYEMQVQEGTKWSDEKAYLFKCNLSVNPLRLRYGSNSYSVRWPDYMEQGQNLFTLQHQGAVEPYYGLRLQVANQEYQNWHFMHLRFPDLPHLNKFKLGAETHLNLRANAYDASWRLFTEDDFTRAPDLTPPPSVTRKQVVEKKMRRAKQALEVVNKESAEIQQLVQKEEEEQEAKERKALVSTVNKQVDIANAQAARAKEASEEAAEAEDAARAATGKVVQEVLNAQRAQRQKEEDKQKQDMQARVEAKVQTMQNDMYEKVMQEEEHKQAAMAKHALGSAQSKGRGRSKGDTRKEDKEQVDIRRAVGDAVDVAGDAMMGLANQIAGEKARLEGR